MSTAVLLAGCGFSPSGNQAEQEHVDAAIAFGVEATLAAAEVNLPPTPNPAPVSEKILQETITPELQATSTVVANVMNAPSEPDVDFEGLRSSVVQYLLGVNTAWNDYIDSLDNASVIDDVASGEAARVNSALNTRIKTSEGFIARINALNPPSAIDELATIQNLTKAIAEAVHGWQVEYRDAVFVGDQTKILKVEEANPVSLVIDLEDMAESLQEDVLARFNIPDEEVEYERLISEPEYVDYQTEAMMVQAAMDLYMADTGASPAAQAVGTSDMSSSTPALAPTYLRNSLTECTYTWTATTGIVTQAACP